MATRKTRKTTRTYRTMTSAARARLTDYVRRNFDVPSKDLATDLNLPVTTIAAMKANLSRRTTKK